MKWPAGVVLVAIAAAASIGVADAQQGGGGGGGAPAYVAPKPDPSLAPAGMYAVDKNHASVTAKIARQNLANFTFRFDKFDASFAYDPAKPEAAQVQVTLDPTSINANVPAWTNRLQQPDMLNTAKFTDIKFVSTSFKRTGPTKGVLSGNVTFLGVTKPMTLDVTLNGVGPARQTTVVGFSATTSIKCSDFGLGGPIQMLHLSDDVTFDVEAEFQKM